MKNLFLVISIQLQLTIHFLTFLHRLQLHPRHLNSQKLTFNWIKLCSVSPVLIKTASLHTNKKNWCGIIRGRTLLEACDPFFWNFKGAGIIRGGTLLEVLRYFLQLTCLLDMVSNLLWIKDGAATGNVLLYRFSTVTVKKYEEKRSKHHLFVVADSLG